MKKKRKKPKFRRKDKDITIKEKIWNNHTFEQTLSKFWIDEPFYAKISSIVEKVVDNSMDTAGVTIKDDRFVMYYNEDFVNSLNWLHRQGLLIHEMLHLQFDHVGKQRNKRDTIWLYATDLAINSLIDKKKLPDGGIIPGHWPDLSEESKKNMSKKKIEAYEKFGAIIKSLPKSKSAEWYYEKLKEKEDDVNDFAKENGQTGFDQHDWEESTEDLSQEQFEEMSNKLEDALREAVDHAESYGWGSVSSPMKKELMKMLEGKIDWVAMLRFFVGKSRTLQKRSTVKILNKRYPYIHPGKRRKKTCKIAICIDQSGSMTNKDIEIFFGELEKLSERTEFVVVPFDSKVIEDKVFTWKKGERIGPTRVAAGGTDFSVPTKWVNQQGIYDAVIFMTDGFCSQPVMSRIPRAWIITKGGKLAFDTSELVIEMSKLH